MSEQEFRLNEFCFIGPSQLGIVDSFYINKSGTRAYTCSAITASTTGLVLKGTCLRIYTHGYPKKLNPWASKIAVTEAKYTAATKDLSNLGAQIESASTKVTAVQAAELNAKYDDLLQKTQRLVTRLKDLRLAKALLEET